MGKESAISFWGLFNSPIFYDAMGQLSLPRCEAPLPPLEGEVPNEREAEGFVR